jgi:N-acetylglucosamine-6-sulfatase
MTKLRPTTIAIIDGSLSAIRSARSMYEASIRAPLIIRGPGVPAGRVVHPPAINVDLAATIVDAANARPGRRLDEASPTPSSSPTTACAPSATTTFAGGYGDEELYDLAHPFRTSCATGRMPRLKARLAAKAKRLRRCAGASCR